MDSYQSNSWQDTEQQSTSLFNLGTPPTATTYHDGLYVPSQGATISSHAHCYLHDLPLQALAPNQHSDWSGELFCPELEPFCSTEDEEQYPELVETDNVFTSSMRNHFLEMRKAEIQQHDSSVGQPKLGLCSSSSSLNDSMQPSLFPDVNTAYSIDPKVAPIPENTTRFAADWINAIHEDLSRFPFLRNCSPQNCGNNQLIPNQANRSLQNDVFYSPVSQTVPLENLGNNISIPKQKYNTHIGGDAPPHGLFQSDTNVAGHSAFSHTPDALYGPDVVQEQLYMNLKNDNLLIPDSSITGLHQQLQRASSPQRSLPQQQQTSNAEEQVLQSRELNPTAPTATSASKLGAVCQAAIAKPENRTGSQTILAEIQCQECPEVFRTKLNALRHLQTCHPKKKKKFPCMHCSASYEGPGSRTVHMRKAHPEFLQPIPAFKPIARQVQGKIRFFCWVQDCKKSYTVQNNLNRHFEMDHFKIRYHCECGKKATTKYNLQTHQINCPIYQEKCERD